MATGVTKIIQASQTTYTSVGNATINFRVTISETYDEVTRKTNLHFSNLQMLLAGGDRYSTGYLEGAIRLKVGGSVFATILNADAVRGSIHAPMSSSEWKTVIDENAGNANWSADVNNISHNADGSLTVTVEFVNLTIYNTEGTHFSAVKVNKAINVELTTIYNPSTLTATGSTIGQAVSITVTRYNTAYTHSVRAEFLGRTETLITKGTTLSLSWTPAVATYAPLMPNSPSATATIICDTYLNNLLVGSTTINVTLNLRAADVSPSLSLTIADYDSYKTTYGAFVATKSRLRITAVPSFRYGSTQKAVNILANDLSYNSSPVTTQPINASATSVYGSVTDSRGFTGNVTNTITILPYSPPKLTYQINRSNGSGAIDPTGAYMRVDYTVAISPLNNINSKSLKVEYRPVGTEAYTQQIIPISSYNVTSYAVIAISTEYTYAVRITLTDDFESTVQTGRVPSAAVTMDFLAGGNGASFGKVAENDYELDLAESWKLHVRGEVQLDKYRLTNPNLLINPWFTVNQKKSDSASGGAFGVDGWYTSSTSSYTVHDGYLNCSCTTTNNLIYQKIENGEKLAGKTVTFSAIIGGQLRTHTVTLPDTFPEGWYSSGTVVGNVYLRLYYGTTLQASVTANAAVSNVPVKAGIKLEPGSVSTLLNDDAPDDTLEIIKCRRFFQRIGGVGTSWHGYGGVNSTPNKRLYMTIPCEKMRTTPAVSYAGTIRCFSDVGTAYEIDSMAVSSADDSSVTLTVTMAAALDGGKVYLLRTDSTAYIDLSAEL